MAEFTLDMNMIRIPETITTIITIPKPLGYHGQIYKITNNTTNKCYIGQTVSHVINRGKYVLYGYQSRWKKHISDSRDPNKTKQCTALNRAIRLYGENDFTVQLLDTCNHTNNDLNELEISYIEMFDCIAPKGYNLTEGGEKHAILDWQKEQISETLKNYYSSDETKKKHSKDHWEKTDQRTIERYRNINITHIHLQVKKNNTEHTIHISTCINNDPYDKFQMGGKRLTKEELYNRVTNLISSAFKNIKFSCNDTELINQITNLNNNYARPLIAGTP